MLENEAVAVESPTGAVLHVVGIGSLMAGRSRPEAALAALPGGQFHLPFSPAWSWISYVREDEVHADGWILDYGAPGNRLYVDRGIGFSLVPVRLDCPPEAT